MADLSSVLFVQTDELNRPTLIASNDTDSLTSSLMPQDVKDTVFIVSSSKVSSNYAAWDSVSAISGLQALSGVSADVSVIGEISGVIYDGSDGWNSVSAVSGLSALGPVSGDISAIGPVSATVRDGSNGWNAVSSVSGLSALGPVSGDISAVSSLSALLFDGSNILSGLSGTKANGTVRAESVRALDEAVRVINFNGSTEDPNGNAILLSGLGAIVCNGVTDQNIFTVAGGVSRSSTLKLQNDIGYISALSAGLVGLNDILFSRETSSSNPDVVYSSLYTLADDTQAVSGVVDTGSGVMVTLSGDRGDGFSKAEALSALEKVFYTTAPSDPEGNTIKIGTAQGLSGESLRLRGKTALSFISENDQYYISSLAANKFILYNVDDFIKVKEAKNYIVDNEVSASLDTSTNWDSVYTSVGNTSSNWESAYNDVDTSSIDWNRTRDTVLNNSGTWESGGGGGDTKEASALLVDTNTYAAINTPVGGAEKNHYLLTKDSPSRFVFEKAALVDNGGGNFVPGSENSTFDFGASAGTQVKLATSGGQFTTSGLSKTLLEFDDKSRVALGRNSVPLEISAFGQSDVRLEDDGTSGAFVLIKGNNTADTPIPSNLHLQSANLSADADCQIDFDTDINLGAAAHLNGNTLGSIHIACKNTQGTSVSGGTPVYIKGNVGGSNKIEIGVASASVASSMPAVGILSEDLADNAQGYVDAFGIASKLNTSAFSFGDTLYVAPTGGLTNVRPTATTDLVQNIGIVELSDPSNGKIIVLGPGRTNDVPTSVNNEVTFASAISINNTLTANGGTGSSHPTAGGQVLQSRGSSTSVTWGNKKKFRWYESDFHSADVRVNGPWLGAAINAGTTGAGVTPVSLYSEMVGAVMLRSSTTTNSGYRWDTQALDRIAPRANLFYECIFAIPDDFTNKTVKLGFYDDATNTTAGVDGTYFLIDNSGNMTPEASNNSTRTTGTSYTLSVDTVYKAQIWWNSSTSVVFKITNMDESTTHASEIINTNLPSGTARRFGAGLVTKSSGTAIDDLLVLDYMGWGLYPYREDDSV